MSRKRISPAPHIYVNIPTTGKDGQMRIAGIFRYLREHTPWNVHLVRLGTESLTGASEDFDTVDGCIIATQYAADVVSRLASMNKPVVLMTNTIDHTTFPGRISLCTVDNELIGRTAAHYFLSHGHFNAAAYIPSANASQWSQERERAFRATIEKKIPCSVFVGQSSDPTNDKLPEAELGDWIDSLPRPLAVFAANDIHATQVLSICRNRHISAPKSVSVLGVDNDELLAENSTPSLSSIEPDFEEAGYRAAAEMDRLLSFHKTESKRHIKCGIRQLVERNSTSYLPPSAQLVANALAFIKKNAASGIARDDVARHLHVSRSLIELRMNEIEGISITTALRNRRLELAKTELVKTSRPIGQILRSCGFKNVRSAENLFRSTTGLTPTQWRTSAKKCALRPPAA